VEKELLFEGKENTMAIDLKEFSPEGPKMDVMVSERISGKVTGMILTTHNALTASENLRILIQLKVGQMPVTTCQRASTASKSMPSRDNIAAPLFPFRAILG
jgi:hypothetical protein